jgi:5-methylcytosine-specific restriction endonuclease McrA
MADQEDTRSKFICEELPKTRSEAKSIGTMHYFTGETCKNGHVAPRFVNCGRCLICTREWNKRKYDADPKLARQRVQNYRTSNMPDIRVRKRVNRIKNLERCLKSERVYRENNRILLRDRDRVRYHSQPDKAIAKVRAWQVANHENVSANARKRRAREHGADGEHNAADILRIRKAQKDKCAMPDCRVKLKGKGHIDHIIALARGGSNWPSNLQILCPLCNCSKHARDPIEFAQSRGLLV